MIDILNNYIKELASLLSIPNEQIKLDINDIVYTIDNKYDTNSKFISRLEYLKSDNDPTHFLVLDNDHTITVFSLGQLPGCCAYCISTGVSVYAKYRNKGVNTLSNTFRQDVARECGYSTILCTDVQSKTFQRKVLVKNGFDDVHKIRNKRTGNTVFLSIKDL